MFRLLMVRQLDIQEDNFWSDSSCRQKGVRSEAKKQAYNIAFFPLHSTELYSEKGNLGNNTFWKSLEKLKENKENYRWRKL